MRLLCISDIQGHHDALHAVFNMAGAHGFDMLLVGGDLCFPGPKPLETWHALVQRKAICVQGMGDRALATLNPKKLHPQGEHEEERLRRLIATRTALGDLILAYLGKLPPSFRLPLEDGSELLLIHGSPLDPLEPFSHEMSDDELMALVADDPADLILCGGSHVAFDRQLEDGPRIVNLGSVGESPASGTERHADATLIETSKDGVEIDQWSIPLGTAA